MNPPLVAPIAAGIGVDIRDRGIGLDDLHHLQDEVIHERERGVLRSLHAAHQHAGILLRKKSLGNFERSGRTFRAMVSASTTSMSAGLSSTQRANARYTDEHAVEESFAQAVKRGRASRRARGFSR